MVQQPCQGFPEPAKVRSQPSTRGDAAVVVQSVSQHKAQKGKCYVAGRAFHLGAFPAKESMQYSIKSSVCIHLWILCCKIILIYQISVLVKQGEENPHCRYILCLHRVQYTRYNYE